MPPPRQYPGLGPLPDYLGYTPQAGGDVGAGTREYGMELLKSIFTPPTPSEEEYRALRERYTGPMRRSVEEAMGAPVPKRTVPERMAEQRQQTERDYYAVPSTGAGSENPQEDNAVGAYGIAAERPENRLGESASGIAEPAPTDRRMAQAFADAMMGLGVGLIGKGFSQGGKSAEAILSHFLRSRRNPENLQPTLQSAEEKGRIGEPTAESLVNKVGPGSRMGQHTIQQIIPNVTPPMNTYGPGHEYTPGYNVPELPFYFQ